MGAPAPSRTQETLGRCFRANYQVRWDQVDSDNLENSKVVSLDDISGHYGNTRFTVTGIEWSASATLSADVTYDSVPPSPLSMLLNITPDSVSGALDFSGYPNGGVPDPNREGPGNVVVTTRNAMPGDELWLVITGREKGTSKP